MVSTIKDALDTPHGRRGFYTPSVMHFAIDSGDVEENGDQLWVQVDVKVCDIPGKQHFEWTRFLLNYASATKILGSMLKPLGLTINPDGMHIRVEEMEETNHPGSMVFVSKEPKDVLDIMDLDWKYLWGGCVLKEELYRYFASSSLFHPGHFHKRLQDDKYAEYQNERCTAWLHFIMEWVPERYPGYSFSEDDVPLEQWYKETRSAVQLKVFTAFPHITGEFYAKRRAYLQEVEEQRLCGLLQDAIPDVKEPLPRDFSSPRIIIESNDPVPAAEKADMALENSLDSLSIKPPSPPLTPPISTMTPDQKPKITGLHEGIRLAPFNNFHLPRKPPVEFTFRPPQQQMSPAAKLTCLARWTRFCDVTGLPYLGSEPREKQFEMYWSDSILSDENLVEWAEHAWVAAWWRQSWANYVGMWRKRFKKEDEAALKAV